MYYVMICQDFFKFYGGILPSSMYLRILILCYVSFSTMALKSLNVSKACDFVLRKYGHGPSHSSWQLEFVCLIGLFFFITKKFFYF